MNAYPLVRTLAPALALAFVATTGSADEPTNGPATAAQPAATSAAPTATAQATPAALAVGAEAPDFTLTDTDGKPVNLRELRGKTVVLEWFNPDCPFVKQVHGEGGALRKMGNEWSAKGVAWIAVNSSAEGKQGFGVERNREARKEYAMTYAVALDPTGTAGMAYGAKTTPHVFVIGGDGRLAYKGAVDNAPLGEVEGGGARQAYLHQALEEVTNGKVVTTPETKSWGCGVKYAAPKPTM